MSGHFPVVIMDNATQNNPSANWPLTSRLEGNWGLVWNALMGAGRVVVMGVFGNDFPQMALVQNQQVIQTLLANRTHPSLSNCIGLGSMKGRQDAFEALRNKDGVEGYRELGITVMNEKAHGNGFITEPPQELTGLLGHPGTIRCCGAARQMDPS